MTHSITLSPQQFTRDLTAGMVVFLVALPLCLGVAMACGAPLFAGIVAGIVGGVLVGWLSGSHTSVSGPSPAATAVVAAQIALLGSFEAFLVAVIIAESGRCRPVAEFVIWWTSWRLIGWLEKPRPWRIKVSRAQDACCIR